MSDFLPTNLKEAQALNPARGGMGKQSRPGAGQQDGVNELDVIIVSADAYVDHPAFAAAIIGRYLQSLGLAVGIIPQPDWRSTHDFAALGKPRLFFGVTAGNMDSMVSLYTTRRKIRSDDPYSENDAAGKRPYLPTIVYTNRLKELYKGVPVIIGGIEASLRRAAHYDYYQDKVRPSILLDSKADLLIYGNGEGPLAEITKRLRSGENFSSIKNVKGTAVPVAGNEKIGITERTARNELKTLPSFESVCADKKAFSEMTRILADNANPFSSVPLFQETGSRGVLINPPAMPLTPGELDKIYGLPFTRRAHPRYKREIPALKVVEHSVTVHRGCYGGCRFCSLFLHQGRIIQSRSAESVLREIDVIAGNAGKNVVITDVGGPTSNMYGTACRDAHVLKSCKRRSCLYPSPCKNLGYSAKNYIELLRAACRRPGVKKVYINSGVRFDLALLNPGFIEELADRYTPGQLSVAPEHCEEPILKLMGKPSIDVYERFAREFYESSRRAGKKQYLIPYFIIGHPGADERSECSLKNYIFRNRIKVEQIQEFYPTPMSISTSMYYTGINPFTDEPVKAETKTSLKKLWKESITGRRSNPARGGSAFG